MTAPKQAALKPNDDATIDLGSDLTRSDRAGFVDSPQPRDAAPINAAAIFQGSPERIGPYFIESILGSGGMGRVYLARQDRPVRRKVAIKVIHASVFGADTALRFQAEQQALARLSHPSIAQMYEAGTTKEGFPYFVMEWVPGTPIDIYCDFELMKPSARVDLFLALCEAVEHAHRRGVLHRDLKPGNVLATEIGGKPIPKVIDFGIAKALDRPLTEEALVTGQGMIGTPGFMSPEIYLLSDDVDTRSDVYALGVMLYLLLIGVFPHEVRGKAIGEVMTTATRRDPQRPSRRFAALSDEQRAKIAFDRGVSERRLSEEIQGDLDWIAIKATARDRDERYGSVSELAADLRRCRRGDPVIARPATLFYQTSRFVRRHRGAVAAAAAVVAALVFGVIGTSLGLLRAQRAEAQALAQAQRAQAAEASALREADSAREVVDFLVDLFEISDPDAARGRTIVAEELLERGAQQIDRLQGQPKIQARLLTALARVHANLGRYDRAEQLAQKSVALLESTDAEDPAEIGEARLVLGQVYDAQGRYPEAVAVIEEARDVLVAAYGAEDPILLSVLKGLGDAETSQGDFDRAEEILRGALPIAEAYAEERPLDLAEVLQGIAVTHAYRGNFEVAGDLFLRALGIRSEVLDEDHSSIATLYVNLALIASNLGDHAQASERSREALAIYEKIYDPDHPRLSMVLGNYGYQLFRRGDFQAAEAALERAVRIDRKVHPANHAPSASRLTNLALVYWKLDRLDEAVPLFHRANEIRERALSPGHPHHATGRWGLANVYRDQGRMQEAETLYREALSIREQALPPGHRELNDALAEYAVLLRRLSREEEARALEERILQ